jgi:hypothetical protein
MLEITKLSVLHILFHSTTLYLNLCYVHKEKTFSPPEAPRRESQ